jgi:hypothetical protein
MGGKKMATARHVVGILKSSDGRIRVKTLSGVSALVAAIALLVGVLPVMADHPADTETIPGKIHPVKVQYGGGSGACAFAEVDSAARFELHINNPRTGTFEDPATGTKVFIEVKNQTFRFDFRDTAPGVAAYDVVVNGGPHNLHYDYDATDAGPLSFDGDGNVTEDIGNLHAPAKNNGDLNNLSHINICYDIQPTLFECGEEVDAIRFGDQGDFTGATTTIFSVDGITEHCSKLGFFFIEGGETTLDFGTGDGGEVAGRADFFKQFDSVDDFAPLTYDGGSAQGFEVVPWCTTEGTVHGEEFGVEWNPGIPAGHTACKVFETEYADATQHTAVYYEFEDPNFR